MHISGATAPVQYTDVSGNPVAVTSANPLPTSGGGGGSLLSDVLLTDNTGALFVGRDNGATVTYFNLSTNAVYTPTGTIVAAPNTVSVSNFPATQPVSGTVAVSNLPATGQATMTSSLPVTIASNQSAIPVTGTVSATNPSIGTNLAVAPTSSTLIGFSNGGFLDQVDSATPLPVTDLATVSAKTSDSPQFVAITGDPSGDFAGVNLLEQAMTDNTGLQVNVKEQFPPLRDVRGAAIPSDAPPSTVLFLGANSPQTIDTTGYQSVVFQQTAAVAITVAHSNDGVNFQAVFGVALTGSATALSSATAATANLIYAFPVAARYMRFSAASATSAIVYLRQTPYSSYATAGLPAVTVSGTVAVGTAASANPVPLGGADYNSATRRIQTDTNGNTQVVGQLPSGYQLGAYNVKYSGFTSSVNAITATLSTVSPVMVGGVDASGAAKILQTDAYGAMLLRGAPSAPGSQSIEELLYQILATLRVLTHYTYEQQLRDGFRNTADEPDVLMADYMQQNFSNMTN